MGIAHERLVDAQVAAMEFFRTELKLRPNGWARRHLQSRRLDHVQEPWSRWALGYAPDAWAHLVDHLRSMGFDEQTMVAAGLVVATRKGYLIDRFRDRIVFPVHDIDLRMVGFASRGRGGIAKHLNSPSTAIYRKAEALFGVAQQRRLLEDGAVPVLVEAPFDALAVSSASGASSRWAGIGLCGLALSEAQVRIIQCYARTESVIVALDGDSRGRLAAVRHLDLLSRSFRNVLIADLPDGEDPSEIYSSDDGLRRLRGQLENTRPLVSLVIELELGRWERVLDHVSGRVGALRAVAGLVPRLPTGLIADEVQRLSRVLNLDPQTVSREVLAAHGKTASKHQVRRLDPLGAEPDPPANVIQM
jgi:DNA primase catalytic core